MFSSFFITFREGLEAFLIAGIIISYLFKSRQKKYIKYVLFGVLLAVALSIALAFIIEIFIDGFEGRTEEIFEGSVLFIAVAVLTYMVFWMNRQAKNIRNDLETSVDKAVNRGRVFSLFFLGFIVVFREGAETVLFFKALSFQADTGLLLSGAITGILASLTVALIFFISTVKINISLFFKITGILVMIIAAGLFATGIHEFQEAGIIPVLNQKVYDLSGFLSRDSITGGILGSLFGYNPSPTVLELISYLIYIAVILFFIRKLFVKRKYTEFTVNK
ncbi:MAG: iron permease [Actinobacteria bacterium]|nr:iron permease [Actinomycetota bacterium]